MHSAVLDEEGGTTTHHRTINCNTVRTVPRRVRTTLPPKRCRVALRIRAEAIIKTMIGRIAAHFLSATAHGGRLVDVACRVD